MNIADPGMGATGAFGNLYASCEVIRHVLILLFWGMVTGLVVLGTSCCCGYAAHAAWARIGSPASRAARPRVRSWPWDASADAVEDEAARGIAQIESYLSCQYPPAAAPEVWTRDQRPQPPAAENQ